MHARLLLVSSGLGLLVACTFGPPPTDKDPTETGSDTGEEDTGALEECVPHQVSGLGLAEGNYVVSIDEQIGVNDCENEAGKGLHIHVGQDQTMWLSQDQSCLEGISDPGAELEMPFIGETDGSDFELEGYVVLPIGTCSIGIRAVMTGHMTGESAFTYRMDATADIHEEHSPDACQLILGETSDHTFSHLPCDQAWRGEGHL